MSEYWSYSDYKTSVSKSVVGIFHSIPTYCIWWWLTLICLTVDITFFGMPPWSHKFPWYGQIPLLHLSFQAPTWRILLFRTARQRIMNQFSEFMKFKFSGFFGPRSDRCSSLSSNYCMPGCDENKINTICATRNLVVGAITWQSLQLENQILVVQ